MALPCPCFLLGCFGGHSSGSLGGRFGLNSLGVLALPGRGVFVLLGPEVGSVGPARAILSKLARLASNPFRMT